MSLLEQQNVLARLYTDREFRTQFNAEPLATGRNLGLSDGEIGELSEYAREEVERFSDSLIWKRLREVEKMIPATSKLLGEQLQEAFFDFAPTFNPQDVRKHYEDAVAFCRFLQSKALTSDDIGASARFDATRLTFFNESKRVSVCRLGPGRPLIAIWLRVGRRVFHYKV